MINCLYDSIYMRWMLPGGSLWIISDPHFNDPDSKHFRGENYPGDDAFVKMINTKVGKKDTLIILGDVWDAEYVKKLKAGYKILIMGNHDKGASNYKRETHAEWDKSTEVTVDNLTDQLIYESKGYIHVPGSYCLGEIIMAKGKYVNNHLFDEVYEGPVMISDRVILSHEPIYPLSNCLFNIHGHIHNIEHKGDSNHLNVCAEVIDYTPINLIKVLKKGLLKNITDIHRTTIDNAIVRKLAKERG